MGTGKSTVGRLVAEMLRFRFIDTDHEIEQRCGMSIRAVFEQHGEPVFRDWERRLVAELASSTKTVIATGGGLPAQPGNLEALKAHALVVCLWASPEAIFERVRAHTHRPLLNDPNPLNKIRDLLRAREPFYRQADVLVNSDMRAAKEVALHVVHQFHAALAVTR